MDEKLLRLSLEYWKLLRVCERMAFELDGYPGSAAKKHKAQARYANHKLEACLNEEDVDFSDFRGMDYTPNLPVEVVNGNDFENQEKLVITKTLEPTVIEKSSGRVLVMGKVLIGERE